MTRVGVRKGGKGLEWVGRGGNGWEVWEGGRGGNGWEGDGRLGKGGKVGNGGECRFWWGSEATG